MNTKADSALILRFDSGICKDVIISITDFRFEEDPILTFNYDIFFDPNKDKISKTKLESNIGKVIKKILTLAINNIKEG